MERIHPTKCKFNTVSLFSGIGGFDLGFMYAGFNIIWANDFDKYACQTYRENVSKNIVCGDIRIEKENIAEVYCLCEEIKERFPQKDIWLYTGFVFEDINSYLIMKYIDVLVDGKYIDEQRDLTLKWRGSHNQRVIDVQKSLRQDKIVLYN